MGKLAAAAVPPPVDLRSQYGERLRTGTLRPAALEADGRLRMELVEGLSEDELADLYAKASRRKQ